MRTYIHTVSTYMLFLFIWPIMLVCPLSGYAQDTLPRDWHLLDLEEDGVFGISAEKAYREILDHKQPDTVIVAVIDAGVDPHHEDLKLWRNIWEKGQDEDRNGYRGDIYGWNFLGGKDGRVLGRDQFEFTRMYYGLREQYQGKSASEIPRKKLREYRIWSKIKEKFQRDSLRSINDAKIYLDGALEVDGWTQKMVGKDTYTYNDIKDMDTKGSIKSWLKKEEIETNKDFIKYWREFVNLRETKNYAYSSYLRNARKRPEIIGDNYKDLSDRYYGNPKVMDVGGHGTHVAGIIGAVRDNAIGARGVANAVKIMAIRAVPDIGDEYDKDVTLAIRYAVDNGAKVINMSFAKDYSPQQKWVEKAIRYAARKDVLIVNGAGNDRRSVDTVPKYPTSKYLKKNKRFPHMITVGASGPYKDKLVTVFSSYGREMVDVFAPGLKIYSTLKKDGYGRKSGTSMASPVVAGLAALLRSYYPGLSAKQVKYIIEASVEKPGHFVEKPVPLFSKEEREQVRMDELCKTGGIVNAYKAVLLAESISNR